MMLPSSSVSAIGGCLYPSFSLQIGRLYPEPLYCAVFVWAAVCFHRAATRGSLRFMALSGGLLTAGFFTRPQLMNYFPALLGMGVVISAPIWLRPGRSRSLVLAFVAACLPALAAWPLVKGVASDDFTRLEEFGLFTFPEQQLYPYGFWMLMDSDGWWGAYQLRQEPFYRRMVEASVDDPELLRSRSRQNAFVAKYVASRLGESVLLVLDNVYRTYSRPANNYQWDYPFSTRAQSLFQKAVVLMAVAGMGFFIAESPLLAGLFFVPLSLALLFGFGAPQPRYGLPSMPILIASAGAFLAGAGSRWSATPKRAFVAAAVTVVVAGGASIIVRPTLPEAARVLRALAALGLVALPFLFGYLAGGRTKRRALVLAGALALPLTAVGAHLIRDRSWHEVAHRIGGEARGAEQEVRLSRGGVSRLRAASEAFVVFDVHARAGSLDGATVTVNGVEASPLMPTMLDMGESTSSGGRNPARYRQWWAAPLPRAALDLPGGVPGGLTIRLVADANVAPFLLYGDRFGAQERVHEGPSFADTEHVSAPKLEYDGDARLPVSVELASAGTRGGLLDTNGAATPLDGVLRVRVITLTSNEGSYAWESGGVSSGALGFYAFSHGEGDAELLVGDDVALSFPLHGGRDFEVDNGGYSLCYRADARRGDNRYGAYVLRVPEPVSGPLALMVRFRSGMTRTRRFFTVDPDRRMSEAGICGLKTPPDDGRGRVIDASRNEYPADSGRWTVAEVY